MKYKRMQSFVHELPDILAIIESIRMPRTFDELGAIRVQRSRLMTQCYTPSLGAASRLREAKTT